MTETILIALAVNLWLYSGYLGLKTQHNYFLRKYPSVAKPKIKDDNSYFVIIFYMISGLISLIVVNLLIWGKRDEK